MSDTKNLQGTYKYGCKGEDVKEIQRRLKTLGYFSGTIGGNYLTKTETAVKAFQKPQMAFAGKRRCLRCSAMMRL